MRGVAIKYGDVAPEAKENFEPTSEQALFNKLSDLQRYNLIFSNYGNPCEKYNLLLDDNSELMPENVENINVGLVSNELSKNDGTFENPIILTLESVGQYSSQGLTFTFDRANEIYATNLNIKWYRVVDGAETLLDDIDFQPDNAFYFCQNNVKNYNKLIITFKSLNMPKNRLRLKVIDYGYGTFFYGDELRNVKLIQEINPLSSEISVNTADFTLDSKSNINYSFQVRQPLSIYFNDKLKATTFVKTSRRQAEFLWSIQSEDYIGLMDSIPYYGDIYVSANAVNLLEDIFEKAKVPYSIDEEFDGVTVTGYIPYTTCRTALMQVAFAIGAVVDTSNSDVVKVYKLDEEIKQTIPLNRIRQGQSFESGERVTAVELTAHTYSQSTELTEIYRSEEEYGDNIFVVFSEPMHDLIITNGTIVSRGTNYAVVNANQHCILEGRKYDHIQIKHSKKNPVVSATDIENIISIDQATLISSENAETTLNRCYNWLTRIDGVKLSIIEGKHVTEGTPIKYGQKKYGTFKYGQISEPTITYDEPVNVGEKIDTETAYLGIVEGIVLKQTFSLNGNIIIKESELK